MICTRFEQGIGRKPGTAAQKVLPVPDRSEKSDENRVQQHKKRFLYPTGARSRTKTGYSSAKSASCTREMPDVTRRIMRIQRISQCKTAPDSAAADAVPGNQRHIRRTTESGV